MKASSLFWMFAVAAVLLAFVLFGIISLPPIPGKPLDVATILGVAGLIAVGIERTIEGIWSVIDVAVGSFWPLDEVAKQIVGRINALGQPLEPYLKDFNKLLDKGNSAVEKLNADQVKEAQDELNTSLSQLSKFAAKNGSSQLFVAGVEQKLYDLQKRYPLDQNEVAAIIKTMKGGTTDVDNFVKSFQENPGRKLISLWMGILLGLVAAWILGLDLLATVLQAGQSHSVPLGIILAGVVMGLGSSPAHEIIQGIQDWRMAQGGTTS